MSILAKNQAPPTPLTGLRVGWAGLGYKIQGKIGRKKSHLWEAYQTVAHRFEIRIGHHLD